MMPGDVKRSTSETMTVGLYGIDRPESAQPHESKATSSASVKPLCQTVEVRKAEKEAGWAKDGQVFLQWLILELLFS